MDDVPNKFVLFVSRSYSGERAVIAEKRHFVISLNDSFS